MLSRVWLFGTPWIVACQAPLSMEVSRKEYWNRLLFPPPGDLPEPGMEAGSLGSPALAGGFFPTEPSWKPRNINIPLHPFYWDGCLSCFNFEAIMNISEYTCVWASMVAQTVNNPSALQETRVLELDTTEWLSILAYTCVLVPLECTARSEVTWS